MTTETIGWGALVMLPGGAVDTEPFSSRSAAIYAVDNINAKTDGSAKLVYCTVTHGDWTTEWNTLAGTVEWGVRETWTDGYVEHRKSEDRSRADFSAGIRKANSTRVVIARTVHMSDWWLAEVTA